MRLHSACRKRLQCYFAAFSRSFATVCGVVCSVVCNVVCSVVCNGAALLVWLPAVMPAALFALSNRALLWDATPQQAHATTSTRHSKHTPQQAGIALRPTKSRQITAGHGTEREISPLLHSIPQNHDKSWDATRNGPAFAFHPTKQRRMVGRNAESTLNHVASH